MTMRVATAEDIAAARMLGVFPNTYRAWDIAGSTGWYRVEERIDTVRGGKYLFCPCPGWKYQMGKGKVCKHVERAAEIADGFNEWTNLR